MTPQVERLPGQACDLEMPAVAPGPRPPVVALTSGKGGVGKTTLVANLAALVAARGRRVLLVDGDYGLANLAVVLGLAPGRTLADAIEGRCRLADTLIEARPGVNLVPGASGMRRLGALSPEATRAILRGAEAVAAGHDLILVDTAAGISPSVLTTLGWADQVVVVFGDDPASFVDGYAVLKLVLEEQADKRIGSLVNRVRSRREGETIQGNLKRVSERFLGRAPEDLGVVPLDPGWLEAARAQRLAAAERPEAPAARALGALVRRLEQVCARGPAAALAGSSPGGET